MKRRIGQKVLLTMLGVVVPSLVMFSFLILGASEDILQENITRQIKGLADKSAANLEELVHKSEATLATIAESPGVRRLLTAQEKGGRQQVLSSIEQLEGIFLDFQNLDPTIQAIRLIDAEGFVLAKVKEGRVISRKGPVVPTLGIAAINSLTERNFFRRTMELNKGQTWVSHMERGRVEGEENWCPAMVRFSTPLFFSDGTRAGAVVINVWGQAAGSMINRLISPLEGEAFLIERNIWERERHGIFIFHQDSTCEFGNQTGSRITAFQQYPSRITDAWMSRNEGVSIHPETKDILAHRYYSPYGSNERGWVVVVNAKRAFFMKPLAKLKNRVFLLTGAVLALAVIAALVFSRSITRPIRAVIDGTHEISRDLSSRIRVRSRDEVGFLAKEINRMAASLQESLEEKQKVEKQVCHSEKLASIGEMASGLAHELNTPLGNILALSSLAKKELDAGRGNPVELKGDLCDIMEQTSKCSKIITGLLSFARSQTPELALQDVQELLDESLSLVRMRSESKEVQIDFRKTQGLPYIKVDGNQVQQVFVNLLLNAIDAVACGGKVRVETFVEAGRVLIRFEDNGCGIAPEHQCKIFDPFFTTKEVGKGTGLGLSVSYGIVRNQGGTIALDSVPGQGTTFTVALPVGEC